MPFRKPWEGWEDSMVRRSIFLPEEVELALAKMAHERGTSVNELIRELLERAIKEDRAARAKTE
jgi:predicted HicB family RNase H-like nuclease